MGLISCRERTEKSKEQDLEGKVVELHRKVNTQTRRASYAEVRAEVRKT